MEGEEVFFFNDIPTENTCDIAMRPSHPRLAGVRTKEGVAFHYAEQTLPVVVQVRGRLYSSIYTLPPLKSIPVRAVHLRNSLRATHPRYTVHTRRTHAIAQRRPQVTLRRKRISAGYAFPVGG